MKLPLTLPLDSYPPRKMRVLVEVSDDTDVSDDTEFALMIALHNPEEAAAVRQWLETRRGAA